MTKKNPFKMNKHEIIYNIINAGLAGGLVFVGALADGSISLKGVCVAGIAAGAVILLKFKEYWDGEKKEYSNLFTFVQ